MPRETRRFTWLRKEVRGVAPLCIVRARVSGTVDPSVAGGLAEGVLGLAKRRVPSCAAGLFAGRYKGGVNRAVLVQGLVRAGLLPDGDAPWGDSERWVVDAGERVLELGIDVATAVRLVEIGRQIAGIEVDALVAQVGQGLTPEAALGSQSARRTSLARFIAATRYGAVSKAMRRLTSLSEPFHAYAMEMLHVPSRLFALRHGLPGAEAELRIRAAGGDLDAMRLLGRLLIGLGRYAEASEWLDAGSRGGGDEAAVALSHLGVARAFLGDLEPGLEACRAALASQPRSALVMSFAAVVKAYAAGLSEDMFTSATRISEALELLASSRSAVDESPLDAVEARLTRGRVSVVLPSDFGIHQQGLDDLAAVLALTEKPIPGLPGGATEIFRLNAAYFLAVARADAGMVEAARPLFEEVLVLDPGCAFAERAYERLG